MNIKEQFAGAFFNADSLKKGPQKLTIEDINVEELEGKSKIVLSFRECDERLICNKTNCLVIAEDWGDETDDWIGGTIELRRGKTMLKGKPVACVTVVPLQKSEIPI